MRANNAHHIQFRAIQLFSGVTFQEGCLCINVFQAAYSVRTNTHTQRENDKLQKSIKWINRVEHAVTDREPNPCDNYRRALRKYHRGREREMEEKHKAERAQEKNETVRRGFPSLLAPALSWATGAGPSSCASIQQLVPNPLGRNASPILSLPAYTTQPVCTLLCSMAPHCLLFQMFFFLCFLPPRARVRTSLQSLHEG